MDFPRGGQLIQLGQIDPHGGENNMYHHPLYRHLHLWQVRYEAVYVFSNPEWGGGQQGPDFAHSSPVPGNDT